MNINSINSMVIGDTMNWKNIVERLEKGLIFLCSTVGIGSILFGSLSGTNYGYHFIIIGILALVLVIIHTARRAVQYTEEIQNDDITIRFKI